MPDQILSTAPLLSPFRIKGSTFYTFSSTLNDMARAMTWNIQMKPSKFALLKLPMWANLSGVQQMFRTSTDFGPVNTTDPNTLIPKMIQNYMENYLQISPNYASGSEYQNSSEQIFWKMLMELGALRLKVDHVVTENGVDKNVYVEDPAALDDYENIVKYVGDITMINSVNKGGRSYTEVYAYVPTAAGLIDNMTWYGLGLEHRLTAIPEDPGPETTIGLEAYPNNQTKAIYDTIDDKYSTGGNLDNLGLWFEDIQTDETRYKQGDFDFNCVLLYYDFWTDSNLSTKARNLYGILFLDRMEDAGSSKFQIPSYTKFQPDSQKDGNAFGFRLNLSYSNASNQVVAETAINDYDTVSMELYLDALRRLNTITDLYNANNASLTDITQKVETIKSKLATIPTLDSILNRLSTVERNQTLLNQSYRVTNEELFQLFTNAVNQVSQADSVNINMPVGYYLWSGGDPYVISPDGRKWQWNSTTNIWEIVV